RQSLAAADAKAASADLDPWIALARNARRDREARLLLLPLLAQPRQGDGALAAAVRADPRAARRPLSAAPHGNPDVGLRWRDRCASAGRGQGRRVVLPQELPEGPSAPRGPPAHLRSRHPLHSARRLPQLPEILRSDLAAPRRCRELGRPEA